MSNLVESKLFTIFYIVFFLNQLSTFGQLPVATQFSNYAVFSAADNNPATIADSKTKLALNLAQANVDASTNYFRWNAPFSILALVTKNVPAPYQIGGKTVWLPTYIDTKTSDNANFFLNAKLIGPAFHSYSRKNKVGFQLGINVRGVANASKTSDEFAKQILQIRPPGLFNTDVFGNHFNFMGVRVNELYVKVGKTIMDNEVSALKVGVSLSYLYSNLMMGLEADTIDYRVQPNGSEAFKNDVLFYQFKGTAYAAQQKFSKVSPAWLIQDISPIKTLGKGVGLTFGFTYEYRPDVRKYQIKDKGKTNFNSSKVEYDWKISATLTDIGLLRFNNNAVYVMPVSSTTSTLFKNQDLGTMTSPLLYKTVVENNFSPDQTKYSSKISLFLPTTLNVSFDKKIREDLYITALLSQKVFPNRQIGFNQFSYIGLFPRYEKKYFGVYLPLQAQTNFNSFSMGLTLRLYGFFIGTNHVFAFLPNSHTNTINAHAGLSVPIYYKNSKMGNDCYYPESELKKRRKIKFLSLKK